MPTGQEKQWIAAWRSAGPELERGRNQELRQLDEPAGLQLLGAWTTPEQSSGLVAFQALMMRMRVRDLLKNS